MKPSMNVRPAGRRLACGAGATAALLSILSISAMAQAFGPGNLIVVQEGDGLQSIGLTNGVILDQFTPSGTLVSQIALPTNGPVSIVQEGNQDVEGFVNLSTNGQELVLAGYNVNYGFVGSFGSATTSQTAPRAVATVDVNGNYSMVTNTTVFFSTFNVRSACSDGNFNFWAIGNGGNAVNGIENGLVYMGTGTQAPINPGTVWNDRDVQLIGTNLYYSTGSDQRGIIKISGTPTTGPLTTTNYIIPTGAKFGTGASPTAFAFNPAMTVCYVADLNNYVSSTTVGGVEKWTNSGPGTAFAFAYTIKPGVGNNTNGAMGITVSFGATTNIYGTFNNAATNLFAVTDTGPSSAASLIYTAPVGNIALRGICFAPTNGATPALPVIAAINPPSQTITLGLPAAITLTANPGAPGASNFWYAIANGTTNLVAGATGTTLMFPGAQLSNTAGYFAVLTNSSGSVTSSIASMSVIATPVISAISPSGSVTVNSGQTVTFSLTTSSPPSAPASNFWYEITGTSPNLTTNLIAGPTGTSLTLSNVVGSNSGGYFAILTNSYGSTTSSIVSLTVIDPVIQVEQANAQGVVNGAVQFAVTVAGTAPLTYQWYFSDTSGNIIAPVASLGDGSVISGATSNVLTFANLQPADVTNFIVIATNVYGAVTSTVASILTGTNNGSMLPYNQGILALWDFDGAQFTATTVNPNCLNDPVPFVGYGSATAVGNPNDPPTSPFAGATDPADVAGVYLPYGILQPAPNGSWGVENFPAVTGTNKQNGVQFNVSTVGARNIHINYDARVSATASEYHRLQYTTNGTTWIDYPASSSFDGNFGSGNAGYYPFDYSLVGFPGVDNNPNFGFRLVTEWQSTATYQTALPAAPNTNNIGANGLVATNWWVGTANSYTSGASGNAAAGTFTIDVVAILGDAITNNNTPPVIGPFVSMPATNSLAFTNMVETTNLVLNFSASSAQMPATNLTLTVQPVNTVSAAPFTFSQTVNPNYVITNSGSTNFTLTLSFSGPIPDVIDAAPIMVTATDTNGNSASSWFLLSVFSANQPPTNTLTAVHSTNTLANAPLTIPFVASGAMDGTTNLSFVITSDNNTVMPVGNIVLSGNTNTGHFNVTFTPAANQAGDSFITVNAIDSNPAETRNTLASFSVQVRPNTNVVAVDYFNYDNGGALDGVAADYWSHLSGVNQQLQVSGSSGSPADVATISDGNTENLQAALLNGPYKTNSAAILYFSCTVNIVSSGNLPTGNGSYIVAFNDGSGNTANVEDCLVVTTNGAAPGFYRLGIATGAADGNGAAAQVFPQDLATGSNYTVVTSLSLNNGQSTLWINPANQAAPSVIDTLPTTLYNIADIELRESGSVEGVVNIGSILVGTSFNSVIYPPQANPASFTVTENTTNALSPLPNDAGWALNLISLVPDGNETVSINGGTNITFEPAKSFTGTATVGYTIQDNLGNTNSSTITVTVVETPPLARPVNYLVAENSVNNSLNPLTNCVLETPGGSLSLVSLAPTNGAASISGNSVLFTPTANFTGLATIGYTISDNLGGMNTSLINVTVAGTNALPLNAALLNRTNLVISWTNALFSLQAATNVAGPYVTIPGATSPYTNLTSTNARGFFRLQLSQ
jgi:hypothetical protein